MKILQVAPYFIPYPGGQEKYIFNLSKFLTKRGHEVHVLTSNYPKGKKLEEYEGITIERYDVLVRPLRNPLALGFLRIGKKLREFDIVHTHNEHSFVAMALTYFKKINNFPLVLTTHGQFKFGNYMVDLFEKIYSHSIGYKIFGSSDATVVNSIMDREYVKFINPNVEDRIYVLHNAIDPEFLKITSKYDSDHDTYEDFKLLYVGRLIRRKGLEWLIKALDIINMYEKKVICIIVGEGEDEKYFKKLTEKYNLTDIIKFKGRIGNKYLVNLYKSSQAFVLPSLAEVCPTVVLEAMHFGLPVVTTNIPGIRDHFKGLAYLVPPRDEKKLAIAILELINDSNLRDRLSRKGKKLVDSKYVWDKVAREYEIIYESVLARASMDANLN